MIRKFKTERAAQQQASICCGLVQMMEEQPFSQITVQDICTRAGVPRRTFYYYFDGKEEVLEYLLDTMVRECTLESMMPFGTDQAFMQSSFVSFFRFWRDQRGRELKAVLKNGFAGRLIECSVEWIRTESLWAEELCKRMTGLDAISTQIGTTVVFYVLFYWCEAGFVQSEEDVARYTTERLTKPFYEIK